MQKVPCAGRVLVSQSCPILCNSTNCSPAGASVHGILQFRILEWAAIPFSRGASKSRDLTWVSHTAGGFFTIRAAREALVCPVHCCNCVLSEACTWTAFPAANTGAGAVAFQKSKLALALSQMRDLDHPRALLVSVRSRLRGKRTLRAVGLL